MTADVELLPLPESDCQPNARRWLFPIDMRGQVQDYARACVAHATAAKDAEIEALRAEVAKSKHSYECAARALFTEAARAERLAEALRETTAALERHFDGTCDGTEVRVALNARALLRDQEDDDA